jgi:predicted enzyme related to lactoylglutathione lyase
MLSGDMPAAAKFYSELLGLSLKPSPEYIEFSAGGEPCGGFLQRYPEMQQIPPHWSFFVVVADCDETVARVKQFGGTVLHGPIEAGSVGRIAILRDPQGAKFNVIKLRDAAA